MPSALPPRYHGYRFTPDKLEQLCPCIQKHTKSDATQRDGAAHGKAREKSEREAHGKVVRLAGPSKTA